MSIQILHTADNHLDPIASTFGPRRFERRRDHLRCFEEAVEYAKKNKPDIFSVSGDLFDTIRPGNITRAALMQHFKDLHEKGIRVYLISGHHDTPKSAEEGSSPLAVYGRSGYATFFEDLLNPFVSSFELGGQRVCITGVGYDPTLPWDRDPLANLSLAPQGDINILMAHYPIEGFRGYYGDEPLIRATSIPQEYQLIAAGHLHEHQRRNIRGIEVIYPGSTERASFLEESESKGFSWIEVSREGVVSAEHIETSARPLQTLQFDASAHDNLMEVLKEELVKRADPQLILRLRLMGKITVEQLAEYRRPELLSHAVERYFHLIIDEGELEILVPEPLEALPRTTPLMELRRYFGEALLGVEPEERLIVEEALQLSEAKLQEAGAW